MDGDSTGAMTSYTFANIMANHSIEAVFAGVLHVITVGTTDTSGAVQSDEVMVEHGTDKTVGIATSEGYHVVDVLVDGESVGPVTSHTFENVTEDHSVEPIFEINKYTISPSAEDRGGISPSEDTIVEYGADQGFSITPNEGYHVTDVLVDGESVGPVTGYTFEDVKSNHSIEPVFGINDYIITPTTGENGETSPSEETFVQHGTDQTFGITPSEGHHVIDVLIDGVSVGSVPDYTFENVTADHTIEPIFGINEYTISPLNKDSGGTLPSVETLVKYGLSQKFEIVANEGHHVVDVLVDGESVGPVTDYTFEDVKNNHTIEPVFEPDRYTITSSVKGDGIIVPGQASVAHGSDKEFGIRPGEGSHIVDVLVDGVSVGALDGYMFRNVTADHTIEAVFATNSYIIITTTTGSGHISPSGEVAVEHGSDQVFEIAPDDGYSVMDVSVDSKSVGAVRGYTFPNVTSDHTIHATFAINEFIITAVAGDNGDISPAGEVVVEYGSRQMFSMIPDDGCYVLDVLINGSSAGPVMEHEFADVDSDHIIEVLFALTDHTISAVSGDNGSISPSGDIAVQHGSDQTFEIKPDEGYHIADVIVDGSSVGARMAYAFTDVTEDHWIQPAFEKNVYTISVSASGYGTISPAGKVTVEHGADLTIQIAPAQGNYILSLTVDDAPAQITTEYTFRNVDSHHTIEAAFAAKTYIITASAGDHGSITPSGEVVVEHGTDWGFTISPVEGYRAAEVLVDGRSVGSVIDYTFGNVTEGHTIAATFEIWDATPPTGSVVINDNAQYTNGRAALLKLSASDDSGTVSQMRFSNDNVNYSSWEAYESVKEWSLSVSDGRKTVYVQFADEAENRSTVNDSIILDTTPPDGSVAISGGSEYCTSSTVTLSLSATDVVSGLAQMRFSNDNSTFSSPETYNSTKVWNLAGGDGVKTVYAKFGDAAANWSIVTIYDSITMDATAPKIVNASPASDAENAPIDTSIKLDFSEDMDEGSVSITISGSASGSISGASSYSNRALTFQPDANFRDKEDVTVEFTATDLAGNRLEYSGEFSTGISVWPGDTNRDGVVDVLDLLAIGEFWGETGSPRMPPAETLWEAQPAVPWEKEEATYADTNGDGTIDEKDLNAVDKNWGQTHAAATAPAAQKPIAAELSSPGIEVLRERLLALIVPSEQVPACSSLGQNYPNPFNPETWIPYQLAEGADVAIEIYSTSGRLIRVLELGYRNAGVHTTKQKAAYWDGRNDHGEPVSSGIYFYRIKAGSFTRMRKLAIVF